MRILLMFLTMISLLSCDNGNIITGQKKYEIEIIDGCEYLSRYEGYQSGYKFTHKGDCKNSVHYKIVYDTIYVIDGKILHNK